MKLYIIENSGIQIRKILYSPAAIYLQYPNGDIWEYVIYDDHILRDILRRHRLNMGRLSIAVKRAASDSQKVRSGLNQRSDKY